MVSCGLSPCVQDVRSERGNDVVIILVGNKTAPVIVFDVEMLAFQSVDFLLLFLPTAQSVTQSPLPLFLLAKTVSFFVDGLLIWLTVFCSCLSLFIAGLIWPTDGKCPLRKVKRKQRRFVAQQCRKFSTRPRPLCCTPVSEFYGAMQENGVMFIETSAKASFLNFAWQWHYTDDTFVESSLDRKLAGASKIYKHAFMPSLISSQEVEQLNAFYCATVLAILDLFWINAVCLFCLSPTWWQTPEITCWFLTIIDLPPWMLWEHSIMNGACLKVCGGDWIWSIDIHCIMYSTFFWSYFFQKKHCFLFQYRSCRIMNHDISIQVYSIPLALPIHQEIYWMYILSESVEGYRTANEPSPTTCEADHHDLSGCHRRWGPTSRTSSGSWHRLCLDRTRRNRLTIFAVRLGPEISLPSLPGPLMGFVLTGSQRGCSDSANSCARRLQHVFRQPKAASSTMQCYRRVWRVMPCYIFELFWICIRLSYVVWLFLGMTSWNFICMLRNCPCWWQGQGKSVFGASRTAEIHAW